jgi:hypothetical protein
VETGEHQGLVPIAGEGVGADAGNGVQAVNVAADRLAAAAPLSGLEELDRQGLQRGAGLGLVVAGHHDAALAQPNDGGRQVSAVEPGRLWFYRREPATLVGHRCKRSVSDRKDVPELWERAGTCFRPSRVLVVSEQVITGLDS